VVSHEDPPLGCLLEHPVRQRRCDAEDEEPRGAGEVLADVAGDPEQREAALVGVE